MTDELNALARLARNAILEAPSTHALQKTENEFLGRNGKLTALLRGIGTLPNDQKPLFGQVLNAAKAELSALVAERGATLKTLERQARERAEALDVTLPGRAPVLGRLHPLTRTVIDIKQVMIGMGFQFQDSADIQDYKYNFDWLNFPPDHPAFDEQASFYVDETHLLRTQTTALQGHVFETHPEPPYRIATIGRCFRYENMDRTHSHTFHQVDGFSVDEGVSLADLKGVLAEIVRGLFGAEAVVRFRPDFFPFVEPGVEVAVRWGDRWLELGGAGLIHPNILRRAGYDTERYTGFAFGLGVDRMPMRRFGVDDLREFLISDVRFLQQF